MTKPVSPNEVVQYKKTLFPDAVIKCWNSLIAKHWDGYSSKINQKEVTELLMEVTHSTRDEIHSNKWLDIEDIYRDEGWNVLYDRPGYNETYMPTFEFKKKGS
jgi:hypothetical protein